MKLITVDNYEELSKVAARELASTIKEKPNAILGLATGGSPVGMYKELIKMYQDGELDFSKIKTVNLDEYVGLNPEHEQSYRHFMNENLFNHVNININNTIVPNTVKGFRNAVINIRLISTINHKVKLLTEHIVTKTFTLLFPSFFKFIYIQQTI